MPKAPHIETERLILTWPTREQIKNYYHAIIGTDMFKTIQWDGPSGPEEMYSYWDECRKTNITKEIINIATTSKNSFGIF